MSANLDLLEKNIVEQIENYRERREHNRRKAKVVATMAAFLSAITTVLIGLSNIWEPARLWLNAAAIICSAFVGIVTVQDGLYDFKKLWFLYTDKWILMQQLESDLQHAKASNEISQEVVNAFYARYQAIRSELNDEWKKLRSHN